jgi:5-formyltetrahydrofolate cyclo-ligase
MTKAALRVTMRAWRDAVPDRERVALSAAACERLRQLPAVRDARALFIYVSHGSELATHDLIRAWLDEGRTVAAPLVVGPGRMRAGVIASFDDLTPGRYGILAPRAYQPLARAIDAAIVPGLAFTATGSRLGAGAGFYDRYLADQVVPVRVGLCFEGQIVDALPVEPHDQAMTHVVTDKRTITCSR